MIATVATTVVIVTVSVIVVVAPASTSIATSAIMVMMVIATISSVPVMALRVVSLRMRISDQGTVSVLHLGILSAVGPFSSIGCLGCIHFVAHLASRATPTELPVWLEAVVPVDSDDATVKDSPVERVDGECSLSPRRILDKAKATWLHLDAVEAHDEVDDLAAC